MPSKRVKTEKPSSASTYCRPGARRLAIPIANAPRSPGPKRLTRLVRGTSTTSAYEALKAHFTEEEQVKLTLTINIINGWNRIAVGFGVWADPAAIKSAAKAGRSLMTDARPEDAAPDFGPLRPKLRRVAYRMLGSVADAEDVVHEAFIRWMKADRSDVREPEAFPAPHGHAPLSRSTQICAASARDLYRPLASRSRRRRGTGGRRHLAADACAGTSFSAGAGCISAARRVRVGI